MKRRSRLSIIFSHRGSAFVAVVGGCLPPTLFMRMYLIGCSGLVFSMARPQVLRRNLRKVFAGVQKDP